MKTAAEITGRKGLSDYMGELRHAINAADAALLDLNARNGNGTRGVGINGYVAEVERLAAVLDAKVLDIHRIIARMSD